MLKNTLISLAAICISTSAFAQQQIPTKEQYRAERIIGDHMYIELLLDAVKQRDEKIKELEAKIPKEEPAKKK